MRKEFLEERKTMSSRITGARARFLRGVGNFGRARKGAWKRLQSGILKMVKKADSRREVQTEESIKKV